MNKFTTTKKIVPINQITPNRWNPNVQSKEMFAKGKQSVETLGMLGSILVRETAGCYEILDGEHRWRYCLELGYTEVPVETMGEIDDKQAMALTVLINNIHGKDDVEKRAKIFAALDEGQLQLMPFTAEEIENEKNLFKFDFSKYEKNLPTPEDMKEKFRVIIVDVPEDMYKTWQFLKKHTEKEGRTELQMLNSMMDSYSAVSFGRGAGQTEQVF